MWASAVLGSPGSDTELSSPKINLKDKICFTFWLDMTVCFTKYIISTYQSNNFGTDASSTTMYLNQEATGIEELLIYLESEIFEEGMPSFQRQKIWEFHEVGKC